MFPAELPDKTMVATVVLVARYRRPMWVWLGAVAAFAVHVSVAVLAGGLLALLPERVVSLAVAVMFASGSAVLWRAARRADVESLEDVATEPSTGGQAAIGSFAMVGLAEWGDLTQIATAGLAARSDEPFAVWVGALAALASVAALAAAVGRRLVSRWSVHRLNFVAAAVFACLALWTIVELFVTA